MLQATVAVTQIDAQIAPVFASESFLILTPVSFCMTQSDFRFLSSLPCFFFFWRKYFYLVKISFTFPSFRSRIALVQVDL